MSILGSNADFSRKFHPPDFWLSALLQKYNFQQPKCCPMSADLLGPGYLHEIWSQDACQKAESERVMGQGEGWLQPYGCQRSAKQYHMPENTATTSCILYKQFSSLLSSVKCNVLRHLNKINIAVELYVEISLVKLPVRQNMPAFRFLYHLELHLGLSNRLLMKSDGEGGCFPKEAGRGSACHHGCCWKAWANQGWVQVSLGRELSFSQVEGQKSK